MAVDDEIWRPGYDGPVPVSGDTSFDRARSLDDEASLAGRRPWRLIVGAASFGAVVLAGVAVVEPWSPDVRLSGAVGLSSVIGDEQRQLVADDDAPVAAPLRLLDEAGTWFVDANPRRLPDVLAPRWTTELAPLVADGGAHATTWVEAVDRRYVVVAVGDARSLDGPAAVHVLDAMTGEKLWVSQVDTRIDRIGYVAAVGDTLVLALGSEIVAYDLTSGSQLWDDRLQKVDGSIDEIAQLPGTELLIRSSPDSEDSISLVDPTTGTVVGGWIGEILGTNGQGRWYVLQGSKILEYDVAPRADDDIDIDIDMVGAIDPDRIRNAAIIGGSLVATIDGQLAIGPLQVGGQRAADAGGLTPLTTDFGTPDSLVLVSGFVPLGGSAFALVGGGTVSGAEILVGTVRFAWQRRGTITASYATERGVLLLIGTDGGSTQTLIDGATGEPVVALSMLPSLFGALEVVADGIVTRRTSQDGPRIVGLDLDGNERWALEGATPATVGDGIVVRSIPQPDGSFEVAAYGDPP